MSYPRCPDCTARPTDRGIVHDGTCPQALAVDRVSDEDRAWFEAHPLARMRWRPMTQAEATELRLAQAVDADVDLTGWKVCVRQLAPGVRSRRFVPPIACTP